MTSYSNTLPQVNDLQGALSGPSATQAESQLRQSRVSKFSSSRALRYRLTSEDIDAIVAGYRAGVQQSELAARYAVSVSSIKRVITNAGAQRTRRRSMG